MSTVRYGETQIISARARNVRGLTLRGNLYATAVATALRCDDFKAEGITVKVFLKRKGGTKRICQDNLKVLGMDSSLCTSLFKYLSPMNAAGAVVVLLSQAGAVKEQGILPTIIDFGGTISLEADDLLECTVTSTRSEYSVAIDTSLSFIEVDFFETAGIEEATPVIDVESVNPNESSCDYDGGDNLRSVTFINTDKTSTLSASQVVNNIAIDSDIVGVNDVWSESYTKTQSYCQGNDDTFIGQSLVLLRNPNGMLSHQTKITLNFNSASVTGGKNYVVKRRWSSTPMLQQKSTLKRAAMAQKNSARLAGGN